MEVIANSIFVENQEEALQFYTKTLGFEVKFDIPLGEGYRWIALVSPKHPNGAQLILEPNDNPIANDYQKRLKEATIPITMFGVENVQEIYKELIRKDVHFISQPTQMGESDMAIFDDTCGNYIQIIDQTS